MKALPNAFLQFPAVPSFLQFLTEVKPLFSSTSLCCTVSKKVAFVVGGNLFVLIQKQAEWAFLQFKKHSKLD